MGEQEAFQRTQAGKAAKPLFVPIPVCYVEGPEDIAFFAPLAESMGIKLESAFGKANAEDLARKMMAGNLPFLVLVDADFDLLLKRHLAHPRVVYLPCYSMENLMISCDLIRKAAADFCGVDQLAVASHDALDHFLAASADLLVEMVTADLAARIESAGTAVCPRHCDEFMKGAHALEIKADWQATFEARKRALKKESIAAAKALLQPFQPISQITIYMRGHIAIGFIRRAFGHACLKTMKRRPQFEDRALIRLMSEAFWRLLPPFGVTTRDSLLTAAKTLAP